MRNDLPIGHWLSRQLPAGTSLRTYAEERAILSVMRDLSEAIESSGLSRAELAELLGTSRSFVSQLLNGSANVTLKTVGSLMWATGQQVSGLKSEPLGAKRARSNLLGFQMKVTTVVEPAPQGTPANVRKVG